jgi:hypothetical protein
MVGFLESRDKSNRHFCHELRSKNGKTLLSQGTEQDLAHEWFGP